MRRFKDEAPITQAVRQVEQLMSDLELTLEVSAHGVTFWHKGASAIMLEEGEEVATFPPVFDWKLIDFGSYMGYNGTKNTRH